jgi:hypothetical protein
MVVLGTDVHKRSHTFVAVDERGRKIAEKVVPATTEGHLSALAWARESFGEELLWVSRTAAICPRAWSVICSPRDRKWCGWRRN